MKLEKLFDNGMFQIGRVDGEVRLMFGDEYSIDRACLNDFLLALLKVEGVGRPPNGTAEKPFDNV